MTSKNDDQHLRSERVLRAADAPEVPEYQPLDYADPGAVTAQFDRLATRDPEALAPAPAAHAGRAADTDPSHDFMPEAASLASGNDMTIGTERGALTRLQDSGTDLAEPADPSLARRD